MKLLSEKEHFKQQCSCFLEKKQSSTNSNVLKEILQSSVPFIVFKDDETITRNVSQCNYIDISSGSCIYSCISVNAEMYSSKQSFNVTSSNFILLIESHKNLSNIFLQLLFEKKCTFLFLVEGRNDINIHLEMNFAYDSSMSAKVSNNNAKISTISNVLSSNTLYKEIFIDNALCMHDLVIQKDNSVCKSYYLFPAISKKVNVINEHRISNNCESFLYLRSFLKDSDLSFKSQFINNKATSKTSQSLLVMRMNKDNKCSLFPILSLTGIDNLCTHEAFYGNISDSFLELMFLFGIDKRQANILFLKGFLKTEKNTFAEEIYESFEQKL